VDLHHQVIAHAGRTQKAKTMILPMVLAFTLPPKIHQTQADEFKLLHLYCR
jgi:hypothetical protein